MIANSTRGLVFGAFMAALTVVFTAIAMFVPITFHLPLPIALATVRHGPRYGFLAGGAALAISFALLGRPDLLLVLVAMGILPGLVLGWALRRPLRPVTAGLYTSLAALGGLIIMIGASLLFFGHNPLDIMAEGFRKGLDMVVEQQTDPAAREQMRQSATAMLELLRLMLPGAFLSGAGLLAVVTYQLAALIFPRVGHPVEPFPPFARWSMPAWITWAFLLSVGLAWYFQGGPEWGMSLGISLYGAVSFLFTLQGMAVGSWWLQKQGWPAQRSTVVAVLAGLLVSQYLVFLGMFDLVLDFRNLRLPQPEQV